MIGSLRGTVVARSPQRSEVTIEVAGVGYRVTVPGSALAVLGAVGTEAVVHTHLHVREDALALFGFVSATERDCFEALVGARGVGPSLALAILSVHRPAELHRVLAEGDLDALTLVPGVGRKTAARLAIELKSRLDVPEAVDAPVAAMNGDTGGGARADVREALAGLGYGADEVAAALRELPPESDPESLLRAALQALAASR